MTDTQGSGRPYGLARPTVEDAYAAVHRVHGAAGARTWELLITSAGLNGRETDERSFERLLAVMFDADPISRLCATALKIRATSYTQLSAAHSIAGG